MDFVEALAQFKPWRPSHVPERIDLRKKAAVLVPLQWKDGKLHVILTVRSRALSRYAGDIAFPGGMQDPTDDRSFINTALREAEEEIGLRREDVRVLCQLRPCVTQHGVVVVPIVGLVGETGNFEPKLNRTEVEEMFRVDLEDIVRSRVTWKTIEVMDTLLPYNVIELWAECDKKKTRRIWGITANILLLLLLMNKERRTEFADIPITYLDIDLVPVNNKL